MNKLKIAVDFDGTCVTHEYPNIGRCIGADIVLKKLTDQGHKLILYTMRERRELQAAIMWFKSHGIPLFGVQTDPEQRTWTESPKAYANIYIDDAALGIPLVTTEDKPYVDWCEVEKMLVERGVL